MPAPGRGRQPAAPPAGHPRTEHRWRAPRHRHRVPARPARVRPPYPVGDQAARRCPARRPGGPVRRRIQVARRPDHADQGPRRLPARVRRDGRRAWSPRRPPTWSRSAPSWPGAAVREFRRLAAALRSPRFRAITETGARRSSRSATPGPRETRSSPTAAHRRRPGRQPHRARLPPDNRARPRDRSELGAGIPAQPAQARQGTALPAGVLRAAARPGRLPQGGRRPEATAGRARRVPGQRGAARGNSRAGRRDAGRAGGPRGYAAGHGRTRGPPRGAPDRSPRGFRPAVRAFAGPAALQRFDTLLGRGDR